VSESNPHVRVLVAYATRHGSTYEIAEAIAGTLRGRGFHVHLADAGEVDDVSGYTGIVLGSAVYMGNWLEPARRLLDEHADEFSARPIWLFSSGPLGVPPKPTQDKAVQIEAIAARTGAKGHRLFAGRLDKSELGLGERTVVRAVRAPEGDFRDWDAVREWAEEIAAHLEQS
jgi:menaquinone-dependent protoporphyrinogen oxidase